MPDLQKFIARFARSMVQPGAFPGCPPSVVLAVPVENLPLLLDEVAKAAAQETVEAITQERRHEEPRLCECCEYRLATVAIEIRHTDIEPFDLLLCLRCHKANWSQFATKPIGDRP